MRFALTEDQEMLRDAVAAVLQGECSGDVVRAAWESETGRAGIWSQLAENGVLGIVASERDGGLGLTEVELALAFEQAGYVGAPEPLLESAAIAVPALAAAGDTARVAQLIRGEIAASAALAGAPLAPYADTCDGLVAQQDGALYWVPREAATLTRKTSVDRTRHLFEVTFDAANATRLDLSSDAISAVEARATLAAAAQLIGLSQRMLDMTVEYASMRKQFGKAIGTFQAVQHRCTDALMKITFARPMVLRAGWSMAQDADAAEAHVRAAKAMASEAGLFVAKAALQVHGAIGYSTEYDLHLYMKRAWALAHAYGTARQHRRALADHLLGPAA